MAGSSVDRRAETIDRYSRSATLLTATAMLVALVFVLVPRASADAVSVTRFGEEGSDVNGLLEPGGIAVAPGGGRLFIADSDNDRIDEYTSKGHFVRAWGWGVLDTAAKLETCFGLTEAEEAEREKGVEVVSKECLRGQGGSLAGQLNEPIGVAAGPGGIVYTINRAKKDGRVQAFDASDEEVKYLGALPAGYGKAGVGQADLTYPLPATNDVAVGSNGQVYVADNGEEGARIFDFSSQRKLLKTIKVGFTPVTALAAGPDGRIYAGGRSGEVQIFDPAGKAAGEVNTGVFSGITAIAVTRGSENLLIEPNEINSIESSVTLTEVTQAGEEVRKIAVSSMTPPSGFGKPNPFGLAIDPTVQLKNEYGPPVRRGAIYVVDRYGDGVNVLADQAPGKAAIERAGFEVGTEGANLSASVSPDGNDTHVYFEYGTTAAYGATSPVPPGFDLGAGFAAKTVTVHLQGLQPGTLYHYAVVAVNSAGTETSRDATFATYPTSVQAGLPDGRAWEQVTSEKGTHNVGGAFAAPGGDGVAFVSAGPLPGSPSGALNSGYVALRGAEGWRIEAATPPVEDSLGATFLVSADMRQSVGESSKDLTGNAPSGGNLYLRDNATGAETLLTPYRRSSSEFRSFRPVGASADFGRIFFESNAALTPDTPSAESEFQSLYEWHAGALRNIGVLPGASTPTDTDVDAAFSFLRPSHPISEDGSRVFFTTEPAPKTAEETNPKQLFVRIDGSRTIELSASQAPVANPEAVAQNVTFVGAAADGSAAFFKTNTQLTEGANAGAEESEPDLYRFDLDTGVLTDLTVARKAGASVAGVVVAADGRSAYFVAAAKLAAGGVAGKHNLYHWTEGRGIEFVGDLNESDALANTSGFESPTASSRVTADGSTFAFVSREALDPAFPDAKGTGPNYEPITEIYRYSAAERSIACISCTHTKSTPSVATIAEPSSLSPSRSDDILSADGSRIFFQTAAPLVPRDTNGKVDVYEWENGSAYLISSGTGSAGSRLIDASASGDDVFFDTTESLVPGDQDGYEDIYDAKVGGGLPGPPAVAPACEGEACRPPLEAAPANSIGSRSFDGPPNRKAKHHRKKHRRKKHRKHAKGRSRKASHRHPATGKRG